MTNYKGNQIAFEKISKDAKKKYINDKKQQLILWEEMTKEIFKEIPIGNIKISDKENIVEILGNIGKNKVLNHVFLPSGGGLELLGAKKSIEPNKIELNFEGAVYIVNPVTLTFHPIGKNPEWWYFRLNTRTFNRSNVYKDTEKAGSKNDFSEKNIKQ